MGCSDSKTQPDNRYAPVRQQPYQQPYPQQPVQQPPPQQATYQRPGTVQAPPQPAYQPAPTYQASYTAPPPPTAPQPVPQLNTTMASGRMSAVQREILEQHEVEQTAAVLSARGPRSSISGPRSSIGQVPVSTPVQQSPPTGQQNLARKNTETLLNEQRNVCLSSDTATGIIFVRKYVISKNSFIIKIITGWC